MKQVRSLLLWVMVLSGFHAVSAAAAAKGVGPKAKIPVAKTTISSAKARAPKSAKIQPQHASVAIKNAPLIPVSLQKEIPFLKQLEVAPFPEDQKEVLSIAWAVLYEFVQANSAPTASGVLNSQQVVALAPLFEMNWLAAIEDYLDPKTFPKLSNDPESKLHTNYATDHLRKAVGRLSTVFAVDYNNGAPKTLFEGDVRDIGVIVNVQNNTKAQFNMYQSSVDGKSTSHIGQINPGLNGVNLHTAALQLPATATTIDKEAPSAYCFDFHEMSSESPTRISVRMMSGAQLVQFLRTLPRDKKALAKDTFEMNGLPTSPEYLAEPKDWYLVLIQNPTPITNDHRNPDQRIQAINISKLSGPYLLTMQINDQEIKMKGSDAVTGSEKTIFQPSFTTVQIMQNQTMPALDIPLLILPKFLSDLPMLGCYWMLLSTTILATQTQGKFFGPDTFGQPYEYFKGLNCFTNQTRYSFFIDLYNRFRPDYILYNAPWLMANALLETDLQTCSDIPSVYTAQDAYGHVIVNQEGFYYINFLAIFTPKVDQKNNSVLFEKKGFNITYADPRNQLYSFIVNGPVEDIKQGIFGALTQTDDGVYELTWTNKKNKIISSQVLHLEALPSNVQITFVNQSMNWVGSSVPNELIPLSVGKTAHFKVTYEYSPANNKHILLAQEMSPIDKQAVFLPLQFSSYPISELYFDMFNTFNVQPSTKCYFIKNGIIPDVLSGLTQEDWQSGIYVVPVVHNNDKITPSNPGALKLIFYKADKTYLGEILITGDYLGSIDAGIKEPVSAYTVNIDKNNSLRGLYLSTGVFLQYNKIG